MLGITNRFLNCGGLRTSYTFFLMFFEISKASLELASVILNVWLAIQYMGYFEYNLVTFALRTRILILLLISVNTISMKTPKNFKLYCRRRFYVEKM
jgi:hypothetical protein